MLGYAKPKIVELSSQRCVVKIPLRWRTKNHLRSMYFGALCIGAEISVGLLAMEHIQKQSHKIDLIFKDFHADFLKKGDRDVTFVCDSGEELKNLIDQSSQSSQRLETSISGYAYTNQSDEPVMKYSLTISVKNRSISC
ncbi:MAG: DUF4442 domain-containing protein [Bdellovibrionales bacterium]|nr:DUF4442 domain-containing protein [Bdellovibrionales bacterium]